MKRQEKEQKVERWHEIFDKVEGAVFTSVSGLTVAEATDLRRRFRAEEVSYEVVKNTLARRALKETDMDIAVAHVDGPTAIAWHNSDPAAPARIAAAFAKDVKKFEIRGGFASGKALDKDAVKQLATMPTFDELRAQILGTMNAVASKLLAQINAPGQHLVGLCDARKEDLEKKDAA